MTSLRLVLLSSLTVFLPCMSFANESQDEVWQALSSRHRPGSVEELKQLAGGEEALVQRLLELRNDNTVPYVAVRAEKYLLLYAERQNVRTALLKDMADPARAGLARAIVLNIDSVKDDAARLALARAGLERVEKDPSFEAFAKELSESKDQRLRTLTRDAFGE